MTANLKSLAPIDVEFYKAVDIPEEYIGKNKNYTKKEYAVFLAKLAEQEVVQTGMLALMNNKNQTIRRMKKMVNTKELVRTEKCSFYLSGAVVSMLALIPTTICSAKVAGLQEDWIRAEEVVTVEKPQRFDNKHPKEKNYYYGSVGGGEEKTEEGKKAEICGNIGTLCGRAMQTFGNLNDWIIYLQRI